jgi:hypothetical protein
MHFNEQVFTRDGWVFVNPYMTLVAAYERLIGGRGRVVRDAVVTTASTGALAVDGHAQPLAATSPTDATLVPAPPSAIVAPEKSESGENKTVSAEHCQTRYVKGHRRRFCEPDGAERRARGRHVVRSVDRDVSR